MMSRQALKTFLLSLVLLAASNGASAQYNLRTIPSAPTAGVPFEIAFDANACEIFFLQEPGQPPEITVQGNALEVAVDFAEVVDCSMEDTTYKLPVQALPAGSYTVELYGRIWLSPGSGASLQTIALQVVATASAVPVTIPADGETWMLLLCAGLLIAAWRTRTH